MQYAVFLKGINVGGRSILPTAELRTTLEAVGFRDVVTILNSGNVCVTTSDSPAQVEEMISRTLKEKFGRKILIMLRTKAEINELIAAQPFASIDILPEPRFYITFVNSSAITIPTDYPKDLLMFRLVPAQAVACAINLKPGFQTTELMTYLEKSFGKNITTRNWQTIIKLSEVL